MIFGILSLSSISGLAQQKKSISLHSIPFPLSFGRFQPLHFKNSGISFTLTAKGHTDLYRAADNSYQVDNAPRLSFTPDADFVLSARISLVFSDKWDAGGIVLESDSLHYIKFAFEKDYTLHNRVVSVVTSPFSDDCNSMEINKDEVYFQMAKSGNMILLYESSDGKQWYLVRELHFTVTGKPKLGFLAQSPVGQGASVTFSDIRYSTKRITDPYKP